MAETKNESKKKRKQPKLTKLKDVESDDEPLNNIKNRHSMMPDRSQIQPLVVFEQTPIQNNTLIALIQPNNQFSKPSIYHQAISTMQSSNGLPYNPMYQTQNLQPVNSYQIQQAQFYPSNINNFPTPPPSEKGSEKSRRSKKNSKDKRRERSVTAPSVVQSSLVKSNSTIVNRVEKYDLIRNYSDPTFNLSNLSDEDDDKPLALNINRLSLDSRRFNQPIGLVERGPKTADPTIRQSISTIDLDARREYNAFNPLKTGSKSDYISRNSIVNVQKLEKIDQKKKSGFLEKISQIFKKKKSLVVSNQLVPKFDAIENLKNEEVKVNKSISLELESEFDNIFSKYS